MKVVCQSCEAKYSIADEKVRGRTIRIRCKRCGTAIVVQGPDSTAGPETTGVSEPSVLSDQWMLSLPSGEQRNVTTDELVQLYSSGQTDDETYAWRDGMSDWMLVSEIEQIVSAARSAPRAASPVAMDQGLRRPSQVPRPGLGVGSAEARAPDAQMAGALFATPQAGEEARHAAVKRADGRERDQDLFAPTRGVAPPDAAAHTAEPAPHRPRPAGYTAERAETSILFTIDALKATKTKPPSKAPVSDDDVVDLNQLASVAPGPLSEQSLPDAVGGLGSGLLQPSLAAPMLPTELEPEPVPEPHASLPGWEQPRASKKPMIILAAVAAVSTIAALAVAGFLVFGGSDQPVQPAPGEQLAAAEPVEPKPAVEDKSQAAQQPSAVASTAPTTSSAETPDQPDRVSTATASDRDRDTKSKPDKEGRTSGSPGADPGTVKPADTRGKATDAKGKETTGAEAKPKEEEKPAEAAPGGQPFSRGAAIAALGRAAGAVQSCKKPGGPTGNGRVSVTFAPSGRATTAVVQGPPFAGTAVGGCIAGIFRQAQVPAFTGSPVTVHKSFTIK